jgi:hypothetical protein
VFSGSAAFAVESGKALIPVSIRSMKTRDKNFEIIRILFRLTVSALFSAISAPGRP